MTVVIALFASLLFLLASGYFSGSEMGLYCVNRVRLRLAAEQHDPNAARLKGMVDRQQETVLGILLGTNLANYLLTCSTTAFLTGAFQIHPDHVELYAAAILSPMIFVLGDVVPKNWFQLQADRLMLISSRLLHTCILLFRYTGVLWALQGLTYVSAKLASSDPQAGLQSPRLEVVGLLREGAAGGAVTEEQADITERVMNLSSIHVGTVMLPRRKAITVPITATRKDLERVVRYHSYSRMPVIDRDGRTVAGIVNAYDILAQESESTAIEGWIQPMLEIEASETVYNALVLLQRNKATMAIVTDPRRGFVGIMTLKDVIEEIFGELPAW
jgi:CBS domain containing-hemolysin-like protein